MACRLTRGTLNLKNFTIRLQLKQNYFLDALHINWLSVCEYLILGTVKSDGSLEIFTIWGLLGNFSKILSRRGSFSLVSALASLCLSFREGAKNTVQSQKSTQWKGNVIHMMRMKKRGIKMGYKGKGGHSCYSLGVESFGNLTLPLVVMEKKHKTKPGIAKGDCETQRCY